MLLLLPLTLCKEVMHVHPAVCAETESRLPELLLPLAEPAASCVAY